MTDLDRRPCARGLTASCFRTHPQWAKQALATRLLHAVTPKALTKRLPPSVNKAFMVPGFSMPPGVSLDSMEAGTIITPATEFPAGWTTGDPLPPGSAAPPTTAPDQPGASVVPPFYLGPGAPLYPKAQPPPPGAVAFFSEPFDNLTAGSWTDLSTFDGKAEIVSAHLKLWAPAAAGRGWIQRTESTTFPENWSVTAAINYQSGTGSLRLEIRTGAYRIRMTLDPPDEVTLAGTPAGQTETVDNYLGTEVVWRIASTGSTATVYMDDVPVIEDLTPTIYSSNPGQINLRQYGEMVSLWDYFNLTVP